MRRIPGVTLIILTLTSSVQLQAQVESRRFMGVGISIDPARLSQTNYLYSQGWGLWSVALANISPIMFYLPIEITPTLRLEPSFGLYETGGEKTDVTVTSSSQATYTTSSDASIVTIGLRGAYISSLSNSLTLAIGPRVDLSFVSSSYEDSYVVSGSVRQSSKRTTKATDVTIGAAVGSEYWPISQFSIGAEVSFNYTKFGNPTATYEFFPPPPSPGTYSTELKKHLLHTGALFFLRWYFVQVAP